MRAGWARDRPEIAIGRAEAERLIAPALPGARVAAVTPVGGGLANTNLRVDLAGTAAPVLLRLYQRDPSQAAKEAALHRLVAGRVPVPALLHDAGDNPVTGGPYAVVEWVEGTRLETVAPGLSPDAAAGLGQSVGATLAAIHGFTFEEAGFLDATLRVASPIDVGGEGLQEFLRLCLVDGIGGARLGTALTEAVLAFAAREAHALDAWTTPARLVHADFNGSNILVRQDAAGAWGVAAVLDWEFALSGTPAFDFGNLLRAPLGDLPGFEAAVAEGYAAAGGSLPADWRRLARIADLTSWADFLARPEAGEALIADARRVIAATIA